MAIFWGKKGFEGPPNVQDKRRGDGAVAALNLQHAPHPPTTGRMLLDGLVQRLALGQRRRVHYHIRPLAAQELRLSGALQVRVRSM